MFGVGGQDRGGEEGGEAWRRQLEESPVTFWLTGVRDNGNLELYSVPDFTLRYKYLSNSYNVSLSEDRTHVSRFVSHNFPQQPDVLSDHRVTESPGPRTDNASPVTELMMVGLGMAAR